MKNRTGVAAAAALLIGLFTQVAFAGADAKVFQSLDQDGNGFLTFEEAEANDDLAGAFEEGDENQDGMIDMEEFQKLEIDDE